MKRTIAAALILLVLAGGSFLHIRSFHKLAVEISTDIRRSVAFCRLEDPVGADACLSHALKCWREQSRYTQIFLNHDAIEKVCEGFYEIRVPLLTGDMTEAALAGERLLEMISRMDLQEQLRPESIL